MNFSKLKLFNTSNEEVVLGKPWTVKTQDGFTISGTYLTENVAEFLVKSGYLTAVAKYSMQEKAKKLKEEVFLKIGKEYLDTSDLSMLPLFLESSYSIYTKFPFEFLLKVASNILNNKPESLGTPSNSPIYAVGVNGKILEFSREDIAKEDWFAYFYRKEDAELAFNTFRVWYEHIK